VSDATIWSATIESSIMILQASFMLIYDVYFTGIAYDDVQLTSVICLKYMPQVEAVGQRHPCLSPRSAGL
jgi:hypothetical protein